MNGEQFYEEFKNALKYLGLGWGDASAMTVYIHEQDLYFSYGGRTLSVHIPWSTT